MYNKMIYVVNEVKGVTYDIKRKDGTLGKLMSDCNQNVIRDPNDNGKPFTKFSLEQPVDVPAAIITLNHKYQGIELYTKDTERTFWAKTSKAINIARNLYNRKITFSMINYRYINKQLRYDKVVITPKDNIYEKINEFCGVDKYKAKFGHIDRNGKIIDSYKEIPEETPQITMSSFTKLGQNPLKIFKNKENFDKSLQIFTKYAEVYGLDYKNPVDMLTFLYIRQHKEIAIDYMDGTKFICPCCNNVVRVNGYEKFIKGKWINTGKTVCETCYTAYKVHDKRDVIRLAKYIAKQK